MTRHPLSFEQAKDICAEFQYLIGRKFYYRNIDAHIQCVAVTPYDDVNKYIFLVQYREEENAAKALRLYEGAVFDVMIIGKLQSHRTEIVCKDLQDYLVENNIPFTWSTVVPPDRLN